MTKIINFSPKDIEHNYIGIAKYIDTVFSFILNQNYYGKLSFEELSEFIDMAINNSTCYIIKFEIQKKDRIKLYKMRQQYLTKIFACTAYYFDSEELDEC